MHARGMADTTNKTTGHQALITCNEKNVNNNIWCSPSGYLPKYHIKTYYWIHDELLIYYKTKQNMFCIPFITHCVIGMIKMFLCYDRDVEFHLYVWSSFSGKHTNAILYVSDIRRKSRCLTIYICMVCLDSQHMIVIWGCQVSPWSDGQLMVAIHHIHWISYCEDL